MPVVIPRSSSRPPAHAPWVGSYVGDQSNPTPNFKALWQLRQREFGGLHMWRCFDSSIKAPNAARFLQVPGPIPFYSLKPPNGDKAGWIRGDYSAAFKAVVQALPPGSYMTVWHEPEDDLSGPDFLAITERGYGDVKSVRPDVTYAYVSMAYQWETNSKGNVTTPAGWLDAARLVDLVTTDIYASQQDFKPMSQDVGFVNWRDRIVTSSGTPWGVTERGISDHAGATARADMLMEDWLYASHNGAEIFLYYDADWTGGNWLLDDPIELSAMRGITAQGRCR